jgi:hypothetical protein
LRHRIALEEPTSFDGQGMPTYTARGSVWAGRDEDDENSFAVSAEGSASSTMISLMTRGPNPQRGWRVTLGSTTYIVREAIPRIRADGVGPHLRIRCEEEGAD